MALPTDRSLNDRRPRFLHQLIGNEPIVRRLKAQMSNGRVPRRCFLFGPSGSGKTTLANVLLRRFFCRSPNKAGEACGTCDSCALPDISSHQDSQVYPADALIAHWDTWIRGTGSYLWNPDFAFFIDEFQELDEHRQKAFLSRLEGAEAMVIFATTHKYKVVDAVVNRFGANIYELRRPNVSQVVTAMTQLADELDVCITSEQLNGIANHYGCDLRKCLDFVYTAREQTESGLVDDVFLKDVLGDQQMYVEGDSSDTRGPRL